MSGPTSPKDKQAKPYDTFTPQRPTNRARRTNNSKPPIPQLPSIPDIEEEQDYEEFEIDSNVETPRPSLPRVEGAVGRPGVPFPAIRSIHDDHHPHPSRRPHRSNYHDAEELSRRLHLQAPSNSPVIFALPPHMRRTGVHLELDHTDSDFDSDSDLSWSSGQDEQFRNEIGSQRNTCAVPPVSPSGTDDTVFRPRPVRDVPRKLRHEVRRISPKNDPSTTTSSMTSSVQLQDLARSSTSSAVPGTKAFPTLFAMCRRS
jgi:hypothetical protein